MLFLISNFPYIERYIHFSFRTQGKGEKKSILGFPKFSYYSQECVPLAISNHVWCVHQILRHFDGGANFLFTTSKTKRD